MKKEPPLRDYRFHFIVLGVILVLLVGILILWPKTAHSDSQGVWCDSSCFLEGPRILYVPYVETHGVLMDCLAHYESNNNPEAVNPCDVDGRPKYGLLQFGEITFQENCVEKYGLPDSIMNEVIQRECADRLIEDGEAWRWGTLFSCI